MVVGWDDSALNIQPLIYTQTQFCSHAVTFLTLRISRRNLQHRNSFRLIQPLPAPSVQVGEVGIGGSLMKLRRQSQMHIDCSAGKILDDE